MIRKNCDPLGLGIAYLSQSGETDPTVRYIDLINKSEQGICMRCPRSVDLEVPFTLQIYNSKLQQWSAAWCSSKWIDRDKTHQEYFLVGCEYQMLDNNPIVHLRQKPEEVPLPGDYQFLMKTHFFQSIDRGGLCKFLNGLSLTLVCAGETIMEEGEPGNDCFIIQEGTCSVYVRHHGETYQEARIFPGGVVGEMAILTGEVRSATVRADTDMKLWRIARERFDAISEMYPDVRNFLTELITERFSSRKHTAKREIGKYLITDIIGKGGHAIVYGGVHRQLNMAVAVKMMKHDMAMNKDFLKKFKDEAKFVARFNHPNIVRVYDIEEKFRTIFIIMEYLEGVSLAEKLADVSKLPYPELIDYLVQISSGLEYAHSRGVIHQDIKPANIFIKNNGQIKILDFGLACSAYTANTDFLGTPYYMSPEQIEMEPVDGRSDIYLLGIVAYEMALGQRPYSETDIVALEDLHLNVDIPDPKGLDPLIPEELKDFILKACAKNRENRFQNMKEVLCHFKNFQEKYKKSVPASSLEKKSMTTLFLFSTGEHQLELKKLLEDFMSKAQNLGVTIKAADFPDL
ncbi:MAG: protein kinase domain-containing protein [Bacteroidota bacterium]